VKQSPRAWRASSAAQTSSAKLRKNYANHLEGWPRTRSPGQRCQSQSACEMENSNQAPKASGGSQLELKLEGRAILRVTVTHAGACRGKPLPRSRID